VQLFSGMTPLAILNATKKLRIRTILTTHDHSLWCANGHCFDQERTCTATSLLKCSCASTQGLAAYRHQTLSACNRQRKTAFNKTISMADHIICCSHWQKNAIDRLSRKPSRTTALHFGTDLLPQEKFPVKRVTRKKPCFGYLGSLSHLKGTDLLIDAIDRLDPDKFTLLASALLNNKHSSEFKGYFRSLIKHPSVRIITLDRKDDLYPQFFSKIDYLIIPSIWEETGPLTLFESLFYRTPVIIARKESLLEKVTLNVNALAFSDSNDLASVLNKIIAGKITLRKTRARPRKTMKEYADEIYGIYKEQ
jgi:glycosyltransferase involved in cell wall biosynthesis